MRDYTINNPAEAENKNKLYTNEETIPFTNSCHLHDS